MRLRLYGLAGALLTTAILAAGCSGGSGPPSLGAGPTPTPTPTPTATPTPSPSPTPSGTTVTAIAPNAVVTLAPSTVNGVTSSLAFQTGTLPAGTTATVVPLPSASVPTWQLVFRNSTGSTTPITLTNAQFTISGVTNPSSQHVVVTDTGTTTQSVTRSTGAVNLANCTFVTTSGTSSYYICNGALTVVPYDQLTYSVQPNTGASPSPSPVPSTAVNSFPINTTAGIQSLAVAGIAPPPTFTYNGNNLSLTWGLTGGSGGGSGESGESAVNREPTATGGSNIGVPTYWINNNPNGVVTPLAGGAGGSVSIQQYGGLPLNGCLPAQVVNGVPSALFLPRTNVLYASELTFTTSGNMLYANNQIYGGLVFVNYGTIPTGTYYALIASESNCSALTETPLVKSVATGTPPPLGQLVPNVPFQAFMGSSSITTSSSATYVIEIFYQ